MILRNSLLGSRLLEPSANDSAGGGGGDTGGGGEGAGSGAPTSSTPAPSSSTPAASPGDIFSGLAEAARSVGQKTAGGPTLVKPVGSQAPPAELEGREFEGDPNADGAPPIKPPAKTATTATPDPEDDPNAQQTTQQTPESIKGKPRDYTGFNEQETKLLKSLPNHAFAAVSAVMKQNREAQTAIKQLREAKGVAALPDAWYSHEKAFTLLPEYSNAVTMIQRADDEAAFWTEQLENIRSNKPFFLIEKYDPKTGQLIVDQTPRQGDTRTEIAVENAIRQAQDIRRQQQQTISSLKDGFSARVTEATVGFKADMEARFAWRKNTELLKTELDIPDVGKRTADQIRKDAIASLPAIWQNHPLAEAYADFFLAVQAQADKMRKMEATHATSGRVAASASRTEPSGGSLVPSRTNSNGSVKTPFAPITEFDSEGVI